MGGLVVGLLGGEHAGEVLMALDSPRCAREVRERLGLKRKTTESLLARMRRRGLVTCVTPDLRQARLYALTTRGRLRAHELGAALVAEHPDRAERWALYAWVQAGRYRRLALKHLETPLTPRALRKRIGREHDRIGANNMHGVLREFRQQGLAERVESVWRLTPAGLRLRELAFGSLTQTASNLPNGLMSVPSLEPWSRVRSAARRAARR